MGSSNFLQHNPTAANQESDATYVTDTIRTGGLLFADLVPSVWLNKVLFQTSTFIAALAGALAAKGYTVLDSSLAVLQTVLANMVTKNDWTSGNNAYGYWEKSPSGKITQWGTAQLGTDPEDVTFPIPFTNINSISVTFASTNWGTGATRNVVYQTSAPTLSDFTAKTDSSSCAFQWQAVGY